MLSPKFKKLLYIFLTLFGISWSSFIIFKYLTARSHYNFLHSIGQLYPTALLVLALTLLPALGWFFYLKFRKKKFNLDNFKIYYVIVAGLIIFLILGNILYLKKDIGTYTGPTVTRSGNELIINGQDKSAPIILNKGDLTYNIKNRFANYPEILNNFQRPSFFARQTALIKNFLFFNLVILIFGCLSFVLGKRFLSWLKIEFGPLSEFVIASALGLMTISFLSWWLALLHLFNFWLVWLLIIAGLISHYKYLTELFKLVFIKKFKISLNFWTIISFGFILIFINLNNLDLIKPFPVGWDEIQLYSNLPKLLADYGYLVPQVGLQAWTLVTGHGFLLFKSLTAAYALTHFAFLLLLGGLFIFLKQFTSSKYALLLTTFFSGLPFVFFQTTQDVKVDLPAALFMVISLILFFQWLEHSENQSKIINKYLYLSVLLVGFAFSVKVTAIAFVFILVPLIFYRLFKWTGFWLAFSGALIILLQFNHLTIGDSQLLNIIKPYLLIGLLLALLISLVILISRHKSVLLKELPRILLVMALLILPWLPWTIKTAFELNQPSLNFILTHGLNVEYPWPGVDLSQCSQDNLNNPELERYFGVQKGFNKILALPWVLTMTQQQNVQPVFTEISYVWLAVIVGFGWLLLVKKPDQPEKYLLIYTGAALIIWLLTSYGIPWYGLNLFVGLLGLIALLIKRSGQPGRLSKIVQAIILLIIISWILLFLPHRLSFATPSYVIYHQLNLAGPAELIDQNIKEAEIIKIINNDQTAKIYNVETFISYFVKNNDQRVYGDAHLAGWQCAWNSYAGKPDFSSDDYFRARSALEKLNFDKNKCSQQGCPELASIETAIKLKEKEISQLIFDIEPFFDKIITDLQNQGFKYFILGPGANVERNFNGPIHQIFKMALIVLEEKADLIYSLSGQPPGFDPQNFPRTFNDIYLYELKAK